MVGSGVFLFGGRFKGCPGAVHLPPTFFNDFNTYALRRAAFYIFLIKRYLYTFAILYARPRASQTTYI